MDFRHRSFLVADSNSHVLEMTGIGRHVNAISPVHCLERGLRSPSGTVPDRYSGIRHVFAARAARSQPRLYDVNVAPMLC
jgi:hypothetical protein